MARILVADDDPDMQLVLQVALESEGHTVALASNGTAALEICLHGEIDLALLDVTMPGLKGHEVVSRVRADAQRQGLPILLVSANSLLEDVDLGLAAGADDYLTKPFNTFELKRRVERMVWLTQDLEKPDDRGRIRRTAQETLARLMPSKRD
ncbi:response regulator [Nocardioides sp. C4-1]|uniref:response regulator n=1 Tax=Nocardioides sp. C4-1 TaxID=3151851 RepID=UPI0032656B64